jgi:hypothetical protein
VTWTTGGAEGGKGTPATRRAEATNDAALRRNAGATPSRATRPPAAGARTISETTAADHTAELAPTTSSSPTEAGRALEAAGLKSTARVERPKAAP